MVAVQRLHGFVVEDADLLDRGDDGRQKVHFLVYLQKVFIGGETMKRSGFKNIRKQVEMMVNGKRTIADFVAEDGHGKVHVFEVKFGSGRLTENQKSTQAYRRGRNAHANTSKSGGGASKTSVY